MRSLFTDSMLGVISTVTTSSTGVLLSMMVFTFILGMVIDTTPLLIMLAGPLYDAGTSMGVDPVHLGVVLVMTALIGTVSPPVALLLCLNCGIAISGQCHFSGLRRCKKIVPAGRRVHSSSGPSTPSTGMPDLVRQGWPDRAY